MNYILGRKGSRYQEMENEDSQIESRPLDLGGLIDNISPIEYIGREDGVLLGLHCTALDAVPKRLTRETAREEDGEIVKMLSYDYLVMGLLAHMKQLEKRVDELEKKSR